jgi:serine/threonine protein kinase
MKMSDSNIVSIPEREKPIDRNDYTGRTIDGYTLDKKLGEGGIGVVYSAEKNGCKAALKFLHTNNPSLVNALQKELDAQKGFMHENVRTAYGFRPDICFDDNGDEPLANFLSNV